MDAIRFEVLGLPAPQGSKTAVMIGGKARLIGAGGSSGRERHKNWRSAVAEAAHDVAADEGCLDGPLSLAVVFRFPMPASRGKKIHQAGQAPKTTAPDLDKLIRALGDSLKAGGLITDDARFVDILATKIEVVGWTGAEVAVSAWPAEWSLQ